jgi:tight adherence protein B
VTLLLGVLLAFAIVMIFYGLRISLSPVANDLELRLRAYNVSEEAAATKAPAKPLRERIFDTLNRSATQRKGGSRLAEKLSKADIKLRVSEWYAVNLTVGLVLAAASFLRFQSIIIAVVFFVIGVILPRFYLGMRVRRRIRRFNNQLGETLMLVSNALKAGQSFSQAVDTVAKNAPAPMSAEFNRASREINLGLSTEDALINMNKRVSSEDFDLVVVAVSIHRQVGGNLAEILDAISDTIRQRIRIKGEIRTLTAQARISGYIITALPFALGGIITLITPSYTKPLIENPLGWAMIGYAIFSISIGYFLISKITAIEV